MKHLTGNEIRLMWLEFFKNKGHHIEKGASLIPYQDPSLLWINSGVAALKKYMDGSEVPPSRRITNVQKSIRTNDMDNVGYTARHHTFFEMLGCFSIGDYFRESIIPWAFEILTSEKYFAMPKDKLYFTYNPDDKDTYDLWRKQGVDDDHLIALETNYWEIGEGPAGPNTEVFFDRGEKYDEDKMGVRLLKEEIENDRYIEIWGIVFSQFNAQPGTPRNKYKELPSKNIDTGAGLERIVSVLQETPSNFETDLFMPIIRKIETLANAPYSEKTLTPYRVIADHSRAITFALGDGEVFSNEGRGYVLRRLVRRAMRFAKKIGIEKPFLFELVKIVSEINNGFYPELMQKIEHTSKMVKSEEEKFIKTLSSGELILREAIKNKKVLDGKDAFRLYDTFGFPIDLTKEICLELGVEVDIAGFEKEMQEQKERARNARSGEQSMHKQSKDLLACIVPSSFDYDLLKTQTKVVALFKDGEKVDELFEGGEVILESTGFYAESGGEVADTGVIYNANLEAKVIDVIKAPNKQHLHIVKLTKGQLKVGEIVFAEVDTTRRELITRNHSATHLLQSALVKVLGDHIKQMGSFVNDEYLRFDFTHNSKITNEELKAIELEVNKLITKAIPSDIRLLPIAEANKLGAKAFFSEKYGDIVRVVKFGEDSIEFCGGCHVKNSEQIGVFVIETEESIASGVRRIQARASLGAYTLLKRHQAILDNAMNKLGAKSYSEVNDRLTSLMQEKIELKKENEKMMDKISSLVAKLAESEIQDFKGYKLLIKHIANTELGALNKIGDALKAKHNDYVFVLLGGNEGNIPLSCFVGGKALEANKAGDIIKLITTHLGGSGGGRINMANGKATSLTKLNAAIEAIKDAIK